MRLKICTKCRKKKALSAFNANPESKDGLTKWCSHCIDRYTKSDGNPEVWGIKREHRERVNQIKAQSGCARCGETFVGCLEFHHIDPEDKIDTIPNLIKLGCEWEVIISEIAKCEVLCANCHRKEHAKEEVKFYN